MGTNFDTGSRHSKQMTEKRREKLLELQRREEMKGVLIHKFTRGDQDQPPTKCNNKTIKKEVNHFMNKAKLTEDNLRRLERRIRHLEILNPTSNPESENSGDEDEDEDEVVSIPGDVVSRYSMLTKAFSQLSRSSSCPSYSSLKLPSHYDWSRLDTYAQFLHRRDILKAKRNDMDMKTSLREDLWKQLEEKRLEKEKLEKDDMKYADNDRTDYENYTAHEDFKKRTWRDNEYDTKLKRDEQVQKKLEARQEQQMREQEENTRHIRTAAQELEDLVQNENRKRNLEKKIMTETYHEEVAKKKERIAQEEEETLRQLKEMRDFNNFLEERENKKKAEAERLNSEFCKNSHVTKLPQVDPKNRYKYKPNEYDQRYQRQFDEMRKTVDEREARKAEKYSELQRDVLSYQRQQMEEKKQKKEEEKILAKKQAEVIAQDIRDYEQKEAIKQRQMKAAYNKNFQEISNQIKENQAPEIVQADKSMNKYEMIMNAPLIHVAEKALAEFDDYY